ncbi:MAG: MTH938/NDUFAF3 family protein [Desulfosarcinaceae bacterium]|nr:MTH938/NDUFAF3 family protein [Desulfosarcinaceae bacterium]
MQIDGLDFGRITIDGRTYTTDVLIFPNGTVRDHWWRDRGHLLRREDLIQLLDTGPDQIVVGTGIHGRMQPAAGLAATLAAEGVRLTLLANAEARRHYNRLAQRGGAARRLAAGFHLTC